jgi:hypothetical protein
MLVAQRARREGSGVTRSPITTRTLHFRFVGQEIESDV